MDQQFQARIERDMTGLMRDQMGGGYVPDFYRNEAGPFIAACESFVQEAVREVTKVVVPTPPGDECCECHHSADHAAARMRAAVEDAIKHLQSALDMEA